MVPLGLMEKNGNTHTQQEKMHNNNVDRMMGVSECVCTTRIIIALFTLGMKLDMDIHTFVNRRCMHEIPSSIYELCAME